jgi:hypothetical protein
MIGQLCRQILHLVPAFPSRLIDHRQTVVWAFMVNVTGGASRGRDEMFAIWFQQPGKRNDACTGRTRRVSRNSNSQKSPSHKQSCTFKDGFHTTGRDAPGVSRTASNLRVG